MNEKPTNALVQQKRTIRDLIQAESTMAEIAKVLPKHITKERMARVMITTVMKTPKLGDCTPASLLNSLMICSQAGLEPDGRLAHLIPYGNVCQVIFDYKGLIALALRNGMESLYGDKVCENDLFEAWVENGDKKLTHKVAWNKPRGATVCYYVVTKRNGEIDWEVMTKDEVEEIRQRSRAATSGPWVTDYDEMGKKTVVRRMSKRWDLLPEIRDVINADDDTPANIAGQVMTYKAPLFDASKPKALKPATPAAPEENPENGETPVSEPESDPGNAANAPRTHPEEVPATKTPPQQTKLPISNPGNGAASLSKLRELMGGSEIHPKQLLDYLAAEGATDGSVQTLEELNQRFGNIVKVCVSEWASIAGKINPQ